ncbi:hypothetical protein Tco_1322042 [Tanacetum coccineum]
MVKAPPEKSSLFKKQFIQRVKEIYGNSPPSSADEIITGLINRYPDYRRQKLLPLTAMAKQALASKSLKRSNDDYSITPPVSKKSKKIEAQSEPLDEEVDLTKEVLRKKYTTPNNNVELEVVFTNNNKKVDLMKEFKKPSLKEKEPINNNLSDGDGTINKKVVWFYYPLQMFVSHRPKCILVQLILVD